MRFRFIGKYTNGHATVSIRGVVFEGYDPVSVDDDDIALKLMTHPEVEEVADEIGASVPASVSEAVKRRGRPKKAD